MTLPVEPESGRDEVAHGISSARFRVIMARDPRIYCPDLGIFKPYRQHCR
jgi:hypothetical protein